MPLHVSSVLRFPLLVHENGSIGKEGYLDFTPKVCVSGMVFQAL